MPRNSPGLENYGWRVYEGTSRYTPDQQPNTVGRLVMPVQTYSHDLGCSITGGYVYRGPPFRTCRAATSTGTTAADESGR